MRQKIENVQLEQTVEVLLLVYHTFVMKRRLTSKTQFPLMGINISAIVMLSLLMLAV